MFFRSPFREPETAISPEANGKHTVCGRTPADLLESYRLLLKKTAGRCGDVKSSIGGQKDPMWRSLWTAAVSCVQPRTPLVRANQTVTLQQLTPPAQGSALSQQTHNPPIILFQYTYRRALPPSLLSYNTQKKEVRTTAHIRRAGGSTLSGVRNNSFWPSTACVLKWSPWVAAYQRAAVIEWVAGITQPGFRTYTSHSKGRAHWASEIHCDTDCVRSCFDWNWMITIPPVLARIYEKRNLF